MIKRQINPSIGKDVEQLEFSANHTTTLKNCLAVSVKTKLHMTYHLHPFLDKSLTKLHICVQQKTCTVTFIVALFLVTKKNGNTQISTNNRMDK